MSGPIKKIRFHAHPHQFSLELTCGMAMAYQLNWFPSLANAKIEDLKKCVIRDAEISWPTLGFDISLSDLLQIYWDSGELTKKDIS